MRERILTATLLKNTWVSGGEKRGAATQGQKRDSAGIYNPGFFSSLTTLLQQPRLFVLFLLLF